MKHATRILWMTILVLLISSCQEEPTFRVIAFNDAETKATEITENSAHLSCLLEELERGRYYKYGAINMVITNNPDYFSGQTISDPSYMVKIECLSWSGIPEAKSYSVDVKSLTPSTTYYFAPIVGDNLSDSKVIGEMKSFTTKGIPSISVTTGDVTNITNSSAEISGTYTLVNEAKLEEFGLLLHTSSYLSYFDFTQRSYVNEGTPFTYTFTNLTGDKTYYYCAYAKDNKGNIYYGETKSFTTSFSPKISVTTPKATNITSSSVTLSADCSLLYGAKLKEIGICISEYGHELTWTCVSYYWYDYRASGTSSPYTHTFNGLTSNTSYYACAYAIDTDDNVYESGTMTFTTLNSGQGSGYSLDDYLGTYTMKYLTDEKSGYQTWDGVIIGGPTEQGNIYMMNLPQFGFSAYGTWDENTHTLIFSDEYYSSHNIFEYEGHEVASLFTPFYIDIPNDKYYPSSQSDNYSYINFTMTSSGVIKMTSPSTAGNSGYYSNAFLWYFYNLSSKEAETYSFAIYDVTLTKTSTNYAPAKSSSITPYKCDKKTQSYEGSYRNLNRIRF